jgi:hypothetical protein
MFGKEIYYAPERNQEKQKHRPQNDYILHVTALET